MSRRREGARGWLAWLGGLLALGLAIAGVLAFRAGSSGLGIAASQALPQTRMGNPVTAVLLDFRAYDTMLEVAVLLLAWIAANAVAAEPVHRPRQRRRSQSRARPPATPDRILARLLLSPLLLVGAYLLWRGADAPGGAFQAGAVVAAAAVVWRLAGTPRSPRARAGFRWLAPVALGVFLLAGSAAGAVTGTFLDYPQATAREMALIIELATFGSVAYILATLLEAVLDPGRG